MRKNNNKIVSFYNMIWSNHLFIGLINSLKNSVFRSIKNTSYKFTFLVARDILTAVKWRDFKFFNKENKFRKHPLLYSVTQKDFSSNVVAYRKNESFWLGLKNANYSYKKFYGALIFSGNCDYAYSFMLNLFYFLKKITGLNPFTILNNIFKTGMPVMYYKRYRRGRKFIKVPCPINKSKQLTLVMRWIIILLKQKVRGKSFSLFDMVNLLLEIYFSRGLSGVFFEYKKSFYTLLEDNMYLSKYLR